MPLLGIDDAHGLPSCCLTLTADMDKLDALRLVDILDELSMLTSKLSIILHRLSQATSEGATRKVLLLVGDLCHLVPTLGRGHHYSVRYESQFRGSLHAHIHLAVLS